MRNIARNPLIITDFPTLQAARSIPHLPPSSEDLRKENRIVASVEGITRTNDQASTVYLVGDTEAVFGRSCILASARVTTAMSPITMVNSSNLMLATALSEAMPSARSLAAPLSGATTWLQRSVLLLVSLCDAMSIRLL